MEYSTQLCVSLVLAKLSGPLAHILHAHRAKSGVTARGLASSADWVTTQGLASGMEAHILVNGMTARGLASDAEVGLGGGVGAYHIVLTFFLCLL